MKITEFDLVWMGLAYEQALMSIGLSSPNPRVGCVLLQDGQLIGRGFTQAAGREHAEVMAIHDAQSRQVNLKGCTVYVTLEPCCHFGRTPPCVDALKAISPSRVVVACLDANPLVRGQGITSLREGGITVDVMSLNEPLAQKVFYLNVGFMQRMKHRKVYARMKWASTLDGKTALSDGRSQWITGESARDDGQSFRARADVLLTAIGTVLCDDPQMNVRIQPLVYPPIKCVVDSWAKMPVSARLFDDLTPVWLVVASIDESHSEFQLQQQRIFALSEAYPQLRVVPMPLNQEKNIDLSELWAYFYMQQINEVHIEAGAKFNTAVLQAGLVDELLVYIAPRLMGSGLAATCFPESTVLDDLTKVAQWRWLEASLVGNDVRLRAQKV